MNIYIIYPVSTALHIIHVLTDFNWNYITLTMCYATSGYKIVIPGEL